MMRVLQAGAIAMRTSGGATEVLIVRSNKDPSHWVFPKGHIEPGETPSETAVRELQEEAGVVGVVVQAVGVSAFVMGAKQVEVTYYLTRYTGVAPRLEKREIAWMPVDEARGRLTFDDARRLLDSAARAFARPHDAVD